LTGQRGPSAENGGPLPGICSNGRARRERRAAHHKDASREQDSRYYGAHTASDAAHWNLTSIVTRAVEVFRADAQAPPPLTLRGANAVDSYDQPIPFNPVDDEPTDAYLEGFAFWGLGYLDARSWRHYLPRLIDYALRRPDDPAMVAEALRPPDRYPPGLATIKCRPGGRGTRLSGAGRPR
jgi:hypothetical protein